MKGGYYAVKGNDQKDGEKLSSRSAMGQTSSNFR